MSSEFVPSTMPPNGECGQEEELWSGDEQEVWSCPSNKECGAIDTNEDGKAIENCEDRVEEPKEGMIFDTSEEAYLYYLGYAREKGFAACKRTSRKGRDGTLTDVTLSCNRAGKPRVRTSNPVKPRPQTRIDCPAHVYVKIQSDGKWRLNRVVLEHNHEQSPGKARYFRCNRILDDSVKRRLEMNSQAGIRTCKTVDSLQIEAGGPNMVPYLEKDCRNYLDKLRRLRLKEGDAQAMHSYFMRMESDNSNFFSAMDFNDKGRLRNVFWADARSREACKEFGDVVTFDTTYLVNKFDMPFAPFVGVNHHGQSILLGCGLISHEDIESFSWLFQTWKTCMGGCAPKAILTDQCMAMKNAIAIVFPDARHRWCIWHIMKKVPEKLGGYKDYEDMSSSMRKAVYNSLTVDNFENAWDGFIKKYELQDNPWLAGMYQERKRWVPAYLKDCFWAGMASTQRSESMNSYFDGFVHARTTLKEFVEQYDNALAKKVENERQDDVKSWNTFIPSITETELEKQFQDVYTHAKVQEFNKEFVGRLQCQCEMKQEVDVLSEYEVLESITFTVFNDEGQEVKVTKEVPFIVGFNAETNDTHCNCRLFEYKGMVCKHQLTVWYKRRVKRVPDKYVLRRWMKNVKRAHTKVQISYDKLSKSIEARRNDKMCKDFKEAADLAEDSQERFEIVIKRTRELKEELKEHQRNAVVCDNDAVVCDNDAVVCQNNAVSVPCNDSFSLGDGVLPSKESTNILDPEHVKRKGRPPCKRKQGVLEKIIKKKKVIKKKALSKEKAKEVEEIAVGHEFGTQESVVNVNVHPSYVGQPMWTNMISHNMLPNMAQGGNMFPFSPSLPETRLNQLLPSFPSSQSNMGSFFSGQVGRGTIAGSQVWRGGQSSFLGDQVQYWGGPQPNLVQTQGQGCGGKQSYLEMLNATNNCEE